MSAIIGIGEAFTIDLRLSVDSMSGHETLIKSAPAAAHSCICAIVDFSSVVSVLVIVCTDIGAPPPTGTEPTIIWRVFLATISLYGLVFMTYPNILVVIGRFK